MFICEGASWASLIDELVRVSSKSLADDEVFIFTTEDTEIAEFYATFKLGSEAQGEGVSLASI